MKVLGISAYYHDSAAALVADGVVLAAAQEERFSRKRHDSSFPARAIRYCLGEARCSLDEVDHIVFYDKPLLKFERLLETFLAYAPRGFSQFREAIPVWLGDKIFQRQVLAKALAELGASGEVADRLLFSEHHFSHAASAFYPSPFESAAVLTMDGVGEWATTSLAAGEGAHLEILSEISFPHSLGLLYSAFTYHAGFKVNSGEYKLMGLAPYGSPRFAKLILSEIVDLKADGSFRLNMDYFDYCTGLKMTNDRFDRLFGREARDPSAKLEQFHLDMAASAQAVLDEIVLRMSRDAARRTGKKHLCLAGGVALNCVSNGKIARDGKFESIWIQPAAGDAGGALGAALVGYFRHAKGLPAPRPPEGDHMQGSLLGPQFTQDQIVEALQGLGAVYDVLPEVDLIEACADGLQRGLALGWFQGRMEFGPRALGSRSILGDPRLPQMQSAMNLKIKFRESFRPFAPSVLLEEAQRWFELQGASPYMLLTTEVVSDKRVPLDEAQRKVVGLEAQRVHRSLIPAVTHVDYSARVQTVGPEANEKFRKLLKAFFSKTGCPVLLNTSFNVRGEPIVCEPKEAFGCFMGTNLDLLAIGNCLLEKKRQRVRPSSEYAKAFAPD